MSINLKSIMVGLALTGVLFTGACSSNDTPAGVPEACITALDTAEALVTGPLVDTQMDAIEIVRLVPESLNAGMTSDVSAVNSIVDTLEELTARTEARTVEISDFVDTYNEAADECRAAQ